MCFVGFMKRVFLGNVLKRAGKRANGLESPDKECENLRDCAYFSTIFYISHTFRHIFWSGSGKNLFWTHTTTGSAKG